MFCRANRDYIPYIMKIPIDKPILMVYNRLNHKKGVFTMDIDFDVLFFGLAEMLTERRADDEKED